MDKVEAVPQQPRAGSGDIAGAGAGAEAVAAAGDKDKGNVLSMSMCTVPWLWLVPPSATTSTTTTTKLKKNTPKAFQTNMRNIILFHTTTYTHTGREVGRKRCAHSHTHINAEPKNKY